MQFKVENLTVNFDFKLPEEDWMGVCDLYVKEKDMRDFIHDMSDEVIDWDNIDWDEMDWNTVCEFTQFGQDELIEWCENGATGDFYTTNSDLQIVIYSILFKCDDPVEFHYAGENPFWFLHDLCHSEHDVSHGDIYVDQYVEEERMFQGMELAKELGMLHHVNGELIVNVTKGFKDRWGYDFDCDRAVDYLNEHL